MAKNRPDLTISPDEVFFILLKARELDAKVELTDPESGSNPADDGEVAVLEDTRDDAAEAELLGAIRGLNDDQRLDLIALIWIGRGDFSIEQWAEARDGAREIGRARTPRYVTGIPLVSDYLEDALAQCGFQLDAYMDSH